MTESTIEKYDFNKIKGWSNFQYWGISTLKKVLGTLLNCEVTLFTSNLTEIERLYEINIFDNKKRNVYFIDDRTVIFNIWINDYTRTLPIILESEYVRNISNSYLESLSKAIALLLDLSSSKRFFDAQVKMLKIPTESMRIHYNYHFNGYRIEFLIDYLNKLCLSTFEDKHYSTGLILTQSLYLYEGEKKEIDGKIVNLKKTYDIMADPFPNNRLWQMVNGKDTFFISAEQLLVNKIFINTNSINHPTDFLDSYSLSKILRKNDLAFKVINSTQYSVVSATQTELIFIDNKWKYRDYNIFKKFMQSNTGITEEVIQSLLFYVLYCSQNNNSSIFFIPNQSKDYESIFAKIHRLTVTPLSILEKENRSFIERVICGDGVNIINHEGKLTNNGCIVNLATVDKEELVGTGETAAKILSQKGVAIKVSQDGAIKIYFENCETPLYF